MLTLTDHQRLDKLAVYTAVPFNPDQSRANRIKLFENTKSVLAIVRKIR